MLFYFLGMEFGDGIGCMFVVEGMCVFFVDFGLVKFILSRFGFKRWFWDWIFLVIFFEVNVINEILRIGFGM